jgi:hypothetical protein
VTKGASSRAKALMMAFKLLMLAQERRRKLNGTPDPGNDCQELWIGEAWVRASFRFFFVFTAFDLNTIDERYTCTQQG